MRFRESRDTPPPKVDLIPMLTVMMGVLAFFVVVTLTLGNEQLIDMKLPPPQPEEDVPEPGNAGKPFIVTVEPNGAIFLNNDPIDKESLKTQMEAYLQKKSDNVVYLVPDRELPYEKVAQFLSEMKEIGGKRVSLAIEE